MKRNTISFMALALAGVLPLASWSTPTGATNAPRKTGTVIGTFRLVGGPAPGESTPARGIVIFAPVTEFQNATGTVTVTATTVSATGRFTAHIPIGTWKVTASSPQFIQNGQRGACGAVRPITVKVGKTIHVAVQCVVK
jgi:hypothetical protein